MIELIFILLYVVIAAIAYGSRSCQRGRVDIMDIAKSLAWPIYAIKDYLNKLNKLNKRD